MALAAVPLQALDDPLLVDGGDVDNAVRNLSTNELRAGYRGSSANGGVNCPAEQRQSGFRPRRSPYANNLMTTSPETPAQRRSYSPE